MQILPPPSDLFLAGFFLDKAEISNYKPMKSHKALFLSMHGGEESKDPISGISTSIGIVLCYVLPIKQNGKSESVASIT